MTHAGATGAVVGRYYATKYDMDGAKKHLWLTYVSGFFGIAAACWLLRQNHFWWTEHWVPPPWIDQRLVTLLGRLVSSWSLPALTVYPFAVLGILVLERLFPARRDQNALSVGLVHDAVWVAVRQVSRVVVVVLYVKVATSLYARYLSFLTFTGGESCPEWVRFVGVVLLLDFLRWLQHYLHHKIPLLWYFHAVHHSARELNLFSDYRVHFVELIVRHTLCLLPMMMLSLSTPSLVGFSLLLTWHARLYHSNIHSDFGLLRYLLVTPQSHRIHHSIEVEHRDKNFGAFLSIWDYLFGTQYRKYDEYPATGITDKEFPSETSASLQNVLLTPIRQTIYPFQQIRRRLLARRQGIRRCAVGNAKDLINQ